MRSTISLTTRFLTREIRRIFHRVSVWQKEPIHDLQPFQGLIRRKKYDLLKNP